MTRKDDVFDYDGTRKPPKDARRIRICGSVKKIPAEEFVEYDFQEVDFSAAQSLEAIGKKAFTRCVFLKEVHLPPHLKRIESGAFMDCVNIADVKFGLDSSLEYLGKTVFYGCQCLKVLRLPSTLKRIDSGAFCACEGLTEVAFSESLLQIGKKAFARCRCLEVANLPSKLIRIEDGAFMECIRLTEVTFGLGLKFIGSVAFYGCESLTRVSIPPNVTKIESGTFCSCTNMAGVTLNSKLKSIGNAAFAKCTKLKEIHIPKSLARIDGDAFHSCKTITSVFFDDGSSLADIGNKAFANCESLEKADFPQNLKRIEEEAFSGCISMVEITFRESALQFIGIQAFRRCGIVKVALPPSLRIIERGAFSFCKSLVRADFSEVKNLEQMGERVLEGCSRIKETLLPSTASGPVSIHDFLNVSDRRKAPSYVISARISSPINRTNVNRAFDEVRSSVNFDESNLFLGRYKLAPCPFIHKSTTCIVMKAWDTKMTEYFECEFDKYRAAENAQGLNRPQFESALQDLMMVSNDSQKLQDYVSRIDDSISREEFAEFCVEEFGQLVALKFMRKQVEYARELGRRAEKELDKRFVVQIIANYDENNSPDLATELGHVLGPHLSGGEIAEDYRQLLVLPFADRTLDHLFRTERPDLATVCRIAKEIGEAVAHLHSKGIVHGHLKLSNIVEINGRMSLINLDASADIVLGFVGSNFSSGTVPPEMIHQLADKEETEKYVDYFSEESEDERLKRAPKFSTSPFVRGYVVRSFLEDEIYTIGDQTSEERIGGKRSKPRTEGLSAYKLVRAGRAFDVWSFGVLLYTLCSREPLFKVNSDDDIADGDSMRRLYSWGMVDLEENMERSISNNSAKALLKSILKRSPAERPTMEDILQDDFFNTGTNVGQSREKAELHFENQQVIKNDFLWMRESLNRAIRYRKRAKTLLDGVIDGGRVPKIFVFLPLLSGGDAIDGFSTFLAAMKGKTSLETKARLYFFCPISLRPGLNSNGEAKGYHIVLSKGWLKRYGHAILIGLMVVKVALTLGRTSGLPMSDIEEGLLDLMNFFCEMQDLVVSGMRGDAKDEASVAILLQQIDHQSYTSTTEVAHVSTEEHLETKLRAAYDGIGSRVTKKDGELKKCGLVKTLSSDGNEEFVHPDIVPVFKKIGSACFELTWEQLELKKTLLTMAVEEKKDVSISEATDHGPRDVRQAKIATREKLVEKEDILRPSPPSTDSGSSQSASPKEALHQDLRRRHSGPVLPNSGSIVHKGWLQFQSSRFSFRWKDRYVVVFENGNVVCYHHASGVDDSTIPKLILFAVKWSALSNGYIELRPLKHQQSMLKARLSERSSSTVEDWMQGNRWISEQTEKEDSKTVGTSQWSKPAAGSRIDFTGQITNS